MPSAKARIVIYFRAEKKSALEKKLVFKLDFFILTFCCLAYFINYLDRQNLTQAYVSGMKEDLNFQGNQLTVINTIYAVGYLIGIVPNNAMLTYFKPGRFFPFMMSTWACICMTTAAAQKPQHIMAIRFFQGYFESCTFAGTHYILGSWYTESELGKRTGIFTASGLAGGIFGGLLQTAVYKSMNGLVGLAGWRWLFIVDGLITLPVAAYGFFFFPDTPRQTTALYFTQEEKELAIERMPETPRESMLTKSFLQRVIKSPYLYAFLILWTITNCAEQQSTSSLLQLWMKYNKKHTYTVYELNNWPTGVQAVGIVSTLLWAMGTDIFGGRWLANYYLAFTAIVSATIILVPSTPTAGIFGAYYWAGSIYACQATSFAWANDVMKLEDHAFRAVIIGFMNFGGNTFNAFWPLIFYSTDQAPYFTRGMYCMIVIGALLAIWTTIIVLYFRKMNKQKRILVIDAVEASEEGSLGVVDESTADKRDMKVETQTATGTDTT